MSNVDGSDVLSTAHARAGQIFIRNAAEGVNKVDWDPPAAANQKRVRGAGFHCIVMWFSGNMRQLVCLSW